MNKLQALNTWMTPKMPLLILGALALGLLFPDQIGLLCPAVSALMMFQTFANSLGSSVQDLGRVSPTPSRCSSPCFLSTFSCRWPLWVLAACVSLTSPSTP